MSAGVVHRGRFAGSGAGLVAGAAGRIKVVVMRPPSAARLPGSCRLAVARLGSLEVLLEGVQTGVPHRPVRREPRVDLGERLEAQLVPPPLRVLAHADEAGL